MGGGGGGKVGLPPPNPLLLPSSPLLPSPQISPASSSANQTPPTASTGGQPALVMPQTQPIPMPAESTSHFHSSLPQSMSLPSMGAGAAGGDGSAQVKVATAGSPPSPGVFSWVKGGNFLSKVVEKTKTMSENVITTLDPQMKEFMKSGGDIEVVVASDKDGKVAPVREAFQEVFGQATVYGLASRAASIAEQPVGFASGRQAALERVSSLRKGGNVEPQTVIVGVESFLYEVTEDLWLDLSCLLLTDPARKISLQAFTQPTPVDARFVGKLKDGTPSDYPKQWSGFAVTIGSVMSEELGVAHTTWQKAVTGVSREELLLPAARALAGLYRRELQAKVDTV